MPATYSTHGKKAEALNCAIFLDRDGTIIVDKGYLSDPKGIELIQGILPILRKLQDAGFLLVMVSNQSGIGRGYFTEKDYVKVQEHLDELLESNGIKFAGYYHCPHSPDDNCMCRKPKVKMALEAAKELDISLSESYMVGDKESDIEFGYNFGAKACFYSAHELLEQLA